MNLAKIPIIVHIMSSTCIILKRDAEHQMQLFFTIKVGNYQCCSENAMFTEFISWIMHQCMDLFFLLASYLL